MPGISRRVGYMVIWSQQRFVKKTGFRYRNTHYKDKMSVRPFYLYNWNYYTGKVKFLYRIVPWALLSTNIIFPGKMILFKDAWCLWNKDGLNVIFLPTDFAGNCHDSARNCTTLKLLLPKTVTSEVIFFIFGSRSDSTLINGNEYNNIGLE